MILQSRDFESRVSTIPPPRLKVYYEVTNFVYYEVTNFVYYEVTNFVYYISFQLLSQKPNMKLVLYNCHTIVVHLKYGSKKPQELWG